MLLARSIALLCTAAALLSSSVGCVTTTLGQGPADQDLQNDGSVEAQLELFRDYEVVYDQRTFRRPGADPAIVAEFLKLHPTASVSTQLCPKEKK